MLACLKCGSLTSNPKFCSKSCAALFNNKRTDINRRKPEGSCRKCSQPVRTRLTYCPGCWTEERNLIQPVLIASKNSNSGANPYARGQARKLYIISGRPLFCALCRYAVHVDICHVKDVRNYPDGTLYSVINSQENLIALCKNHHWEFDHDIL